MDEAALGKAEGDLVAWGLLERGPQGVAWTRRFRGAVMREAGRLAEEERAGRKPAGHPIELAVRGALKGWELPQGVQATQAHERLLAAVELAALPESLREFLGGGPTR